MPELNLSGIDLNPLVSFDNTEDDTPKNPSPNNGGLDLSGIDTSNLLSSTKSKTKSNSNRGEVFQPDNSPWNISGLGSVQEFYKNTIGSDLPITNKGQGKIHNSWGLDHRNSADIGLDPKSKEGQQLISYLKENNIPFAAFNGPVPGVATDKHIHVGFLSKKTNQKYPVGSTLEGTSDNNQEPKQDLNLEGIDTSSLVQDNQQTKPDEITSGVKGVQLNTEGIDTSILPDPSLAVDPLKVNFAKADNSRYSYIAQLTNSYLQGNKPVMVGKNPLELGNPIIVEHDFSPNYSLPSSVKQPEPDLNTITDIWLNAWNPEYKTLNDKYRQETGGNNIIDLGNPGNLIKLDGYKYRIQARPSRSDQADFEAYKEHGVAGIIASRNLAAEQVRNYQADYASQLAQIKSAAQDHPYLKDLLAFTNPLLMQKSPIAQEEAVAIGNIALNLKYMAQALYIDVTKGITTPEGNEAYVDLINQRNRDAELVQSDQEAIPSAQGFGQKVVRGGGSAIVSLPRIIGSEVLAGPAGFPAMVYLENQHRGFRTAALSALPAAILSFAGPIVGKTAENFFTATKNGTLQLTEKGLADYAKSLNTNIPIKELTPFQRQLVLRGANAFTLVGPSLALNPKQSLTDIAANLTIGISFPVGKKVEVQKELPALETGEQVKTSATPLGLEPARVNVPLAPTTILGENNRDISTTFLPSGEAPENKYGERPSSALANRNLEKGFVATQEGATLHLPIDTAALNYLELERSLKDGSYKNKGDSLTDDLAKQQSIQTVMDTLKEGIPDEALEFFRQNEKAIRTSLQGNYELNQAKGSLLQKRAEALKPDDIKPTGIEEPNSRDTLGMFSNLVRELSGQTKEEDDNSSIVSHMEIQDEEGNTRVAVGIDPSLITTLAKNLYSGDIGTIVIKELLQNASDAVKASKKVGRFTSIERGNVSLAIDTRARTIHIDDDGIGMPPSVLMKEFADLGGTLKQAQESSGGYGIAKAAMFFNAENIDVVSRYKDSSTRKVIISHLSGSAEDWLNPEKGLKFESHEVDGNIDQGTTVELKLKPGDEKNKVGMSEWGINSFLSGFLNTHRLPINFNMQINGKSADSWNRTNPNNISHSQTIRLSGGDLEIYTSKETTDTSYPSLMLLNHGLPQKEIHISVGESMKLPKTTIVDVKAKGFPKDEDYPWRPDREGLRQDAQAALEKYFQSDLVADAARKERQTYINAIRKGVNINGTTVDPIKRDRGQALKSKEDLSFEQILDLLTGLDVTKDQFENDKDVRNSVYQLLVQKDQQEIGKLPVPTKQKVIDTNGFIPEEVTKKLANDPSTQKFSKLVGTITNEFLTKLGKYADSYYDAEYYGIGLGKNYYAVNVTGSAIFGDAAKNIILVNPYNTIDTIERLVSNGLINSNDAPMEMARQTIASIAHEATHQVARSHNESFSSELTNNMGRTLDEQVFGAAKLAKLLSKNNGEVYNAIREHATEVKNAIRDGEDIFSKISTNASTEQYKSESSKTTDLRNEEQKSGLSEGLRRSNDRTTRELEPSTIERDITTQKQEAVTNRNKITSQDGFDEHRNNLIEALTNDTNATNPADNTVFGAGLSPDAFTDLTKLTYSDFKDFVSFSKELVGKFGDAIKPYLQDLWIQTKGLANKVGEGIDALDSYISQGKDSPYFKARQMGEGGFIGSKKTIGDEAEKAYKETRRKVPYYEWFSWWRNTGLAQLSEEYSKVYEPLRSGQRVKNSLGSFVLKNLTSANNIAIENSSPNLAKTIWIGNQYGIDGTKGKTYTDAELTAGDSKLNRPALNAEEIKAYHSVRNAIDAGLYIRENTKLKPMFDRANDLNDQLNAATPGTPLHDSIKEKLLDLDSAITGVKAHFQQLKDTGYISTQRRGPIAAYAEDPNFPVGNPDRQLYRQFDSSKAAKEWLDEQVNKFGAIVDPATAIRDIRKPVELRAAAANLTPGQFEDLIDSSGVNSKDPEVEKIREEVYSRYPSMGYELKRDFVRGYDDSWKGVMESVAHQTETYGSSWYSRVAGEEARIALDNTNLQKTKYDLYQTAQKYIDHEISSPEESILAKRTMQAKKAVFLFQIGHDIGMLWRHGLAQPVSQTYSYFSRVENNGITLKGAEPEQYFTRAGALTGRMGKEYLQQFTDANYSDSKIPQEFKDIYQRLKDERVLTTEFTRDLLEMESDKTVQSQLNQQVSNKGLVRKFFTPSQQEHWAGAFLRGGIKTARTHVAAEAYLVGTEKFNLAGEDLVDFIVRAVDSTSMNFSRAEAPLIVRGVSNTGYGRKLLYQFEAFNHMWTENLALNVKADFEETYKAINDSNASKLDVAGNIITDLKVNKAASTIRHLAPLALMSGIRNLPLAGFAGLLYTLISGDDPKKKFDKWLGNDTVLENLALNGITGNPSIAQKAAPSFPFMDKIHLNDSLKGTLADTFSTSNVPVFSTSAQIAQGLTDLYKGQNLRAAGELLPFKPLRGFATAERYRETGIRDRAGKVLVPRNKVTEPQKVLQVTGLTPAPLLERYNQQTTRKIQDFRRTAVVPLVRKLKRAL